jgi:ribonucleotide reductase beta subunit family protein with ferritin-like domain
MPRERFEAFAAVKNIPSIRRKAEFCFRWIDGIYDLRELRTTGDGWSFLLNLICFAACIEGLVFYGTFAYVYFLRSRGLHPHPEGAGNGLVARRPARRECASSACRLPVEAAVGL